MKEIQIPLAVKFGVKNLNGWTVEKEVYENILSSPSIKEKMNTSCLYVEKIMGKPSEIHTQNIIASIKNIDIDNRLATLLVYKYYNFTNKELACVYQSEDNKIVGVIKFHLIDADKSAYKDC